MCEMLDREWLIKNISTLVNEEFNTTLFTEEENNSTSPVDCNTGLNAAIFVPNLIISVVHPIVMVISSVIVPYMDRRLIISEYFNQMFLLRFVRFCEPQIETIKIITSKSFNYSGWAF